MAKRAMHQNTLLNLFDFSIGSLSNTLPLMSHRIGTHILWSLNVYSGRIHLLPQCADALRTPGMETDMHKMPSQVIFTFRSTYKLRLFKGLAVGLLKSLQAVFSLFLAGLTHHLLIGSASKLGKKNHCLQFWGSMRKQPWHLLRRPRQG